MTGERFTKTEQLYDWSDIRAEIQDATPQEPSFEDVYSSTEIQRDLQKIQSIKQRLGVKAEQGIPDSRIQEYTTANEISQSDWFGEDKRLAELFPGQRGCKTSVFLTSEFDDFVNHIDAIAVMNNQDSGFRPVPFALDMTYNTDPAKLHRKFNWLHPHHGFQMPGLATAKYFEDTFNFDPQLPKGKIPVMPRFVIGYSPELSLEITEQTMTSTGWNSLRLPELSSKAKWCVLQELKCQSANLLDQLQPRLPQNPRLQTVYHHTQSLDRFFSGAIQAAKEIDQNHPDWIAYPNRDPVCQAILLQSQLNSHT